MSTSSPQEVQPGHLVELFREAGSSHHSAFAATNGDDPEWPIWYADFLYERCAPEVRAKMTRSEIVYLLVRAEKERQAKDRDAYWPAFHADVFLSYLAPKPASGGL